ncbi:MAG: hypothetical protein IJF80_04610 [Clostridia bacterium]|nr:hypothetical protein [Clostridia bacterium]
MNTNETVLTILEAITGIEKSDLEENLELDLLENGILDSLSTVTMVSELSKALDKPLSLQSFELSDFRSVSSITSALEKL